MYKIIYTKEKRTLEEFDTKASLIEFLRSRDSWSRDYDEALQKLGSNEFPDGYLGCEFYDEKTDEYVEIPEETQNRRQKEVESEFNEEIVSNWNHYTENWPSPIGVIPVYEIVEA